MKLPPYFLILVSAAALTEPLAAQPFTSRVMVPMLSAAYDVIAADLDGDGFQDGIVSAISTQSVRWFKGSPLGPAAPHVFVYDGNSWKSELDAADMDGDGDIDVVSIETLGNAVTLHENLGSGVFASEIFLSTDHQRPHALAVSDIDGDGTLDVLVSSTLDDRVTWYRGLGSLAFAPGADLPGTKSRPKDAFPVDLDGDGDMDVLYACSGSDEVGWYENTGGSTFLPAATIASGISNAGQIRPGDFDHDGDLDLVATSIDDGIVRVLLRDGMSFVMQPPIVTGAGGITEVKLVDINGDRQLDLLLSSNFALYAIQLCVGQGDGTFSPAATIHAEVGATYGILRLTWMATGTKMSCMRTTALASTSGCGMT